VANPHRKLPAVSAEYLPLFTYLDRRFADRVVLTFDEMEDILGGALPEGARLDATWWAAPPGDAPSQPHALAWTNANRTATPNLPAHCVAFERVRD
jgi:hypothetical protein